MSYDWRTIERGNHRDNLCCQCENLCWPDQLCWCCCLLAAVTELRASEAAVSRVRDVCEKAEQRSRDRKPGGSFILAETIMRALGSD